MDMKLAEPDSSFPQKLEEATGLYYAVLYGIVSFLLVLVIILLLYVACTKRYRLNWFERNLLENAETRELATSHDALIGVESSRRDDFWVPVGKSGNLEPAESSEDESEAGESLCTSRGSKTSLTVDSSRTCGDDISLGLVPAPIARNDRHVVLTSAMPGKPLVSMNTRLDLSKIDTALYEQPAGSAIKVEAEESRGQVHISLAYDAAAGMLSVRLIEAQNLHPRDIGGTMDPYAKIRVLPDKTNVWQTRIHKKTLNPVFDEDFVFEVRALAFSRRTLEIILYDFDAYSRHCSIGGLKLSLARLDLTEKLTFWKNLTPCSNVDDKAELGDLMVSLSFLPSAERLTVVIIKARNLRVIDENRAASDPYVKVTLFQGNKRLKKKKTSIHRNTVNPTFNERLIFDVSKDLISKCSLELGVYHDAKLGTSELLGRCIVGSSSSCRPEDKEFFQELLMNKTANAKWLVLTDPR